MTLRTDIAGTESESGKHAAYHNEVNQDVLNLQAGIVTSTQQAGNWTFALADAGTVVEGTGTSSQIFTVPPHSSVAFAIGTTIEVFQYGAGQVTIAAGAGVTLHSDNARVSVAGRYGTIGLRQRAVDEWILSGDLA